MGNIKAKSFNSPSVVISIGTLVKSYCKYYLLETVIQWFTAESQANSIYKSPQKIIKPKIKII